MQGSVSDVYARVDVHVWHEKNLMYVYNNKYMQEYNDLLIILIHTWIKVVVSRDRYHSFTQEVNCTD